jgi:4-hydroxybenzoate polyprenyltransferase
MNYSIILLISYILSLAYQIKIFDRKKPITCLRAFKINNLSGLLLYSTIMSLSLK